MAKHRALMREQAKRRQKKAPANKQKAQPEATTNKTKAQPEVKKRRRSKKGPERTDLVVSPQYVDKLEREMKSAFPTHERVKPLVPTYRTAKYTIKKLKERNSTFYQIRVNGAVLMQATCNMFGDHALAAAMAIQQLHRKGYSKETWVTQGSDKECVCILVVCSLYRYAMFPFVVCVLRSTTSSAQHVLTHASTDN